MVKKTRHRRGEVVVSVWRGEDGRFLTMPRAAGAAQKLRVMAHRLAGSERERTGPRLRWGAKGTAGWWYVPQGPGPYWVRRTATSMWIRGHYYVPDHWGPVVGPGQLDRREGRIRVGQPMSQPEVPVDVWNAAKHDVIHPAGMKYDSVRTTAFRRRTKATKSRKTAVRHSPY
jgi:hypothetical protein